MSEILDLGAVYERAKEAARGSVMGSPASDYGLEDVMTEKQWAATLSSAFGSLIPIYGTFDGCVEGLVLRGAGAADVETVQVQPPAGTAVTDEDLRVARSWLADSFAASLDDDGRQAMVDREALHRGWISDPKRLSSMVLAIVRVAGAAADK